MQFAVIPYNTKSEPVIEWFATQAEAEQALAAEANDWLSMGERHWAVVQLVKAGALEAAVCRRVFPTEVIGERRRVFPTTEVKGETMNNQLMNAFALAHRASESDVYTPAARRMFRVIAQHIWASQAKPAEVPATMTREVARG